MTVDSKILNGVGKKVRSAFYSGKVSEEEILAIYSRNQKDADSFDSFGWNNSELLQEERTTHNPILRDKIHSLLEEKKHKSINSRAQNALSMAKLSYYHDSALGIGLRPVMNAVSRKAYEGDKEAEILLLLMQIEFANLYAKKRPSLQKIIYERKDILLKQVSDLLYECGWKCGVEVASGKNASYIIYVYLPDNSQLSWHCNDYSIFSYYNDIDCGWDGKVCSTMEKLLEFAHDRYEIGYPLERYDHAMAS